VKAHQNQVEKNVRSLMKPWERYVTCCHCNNPLDDNLRMKDALKINNAASWAKNRLKILADTASDRDGMDWIARELREIEAGIEVMPDANERGNLCPN